MSAIPAHVKRKLIDAVREEHAVLWVLAPSATAVDWSAGIRELWELWRRELKETVAPPPRPDATNYHEARDALDLFHRAVETLSGEEPSTVYHHGEHSYSLGDTPPVVVTTEEHYALQAFMTTRRALDTKELQQRVSNPCRIMKQLDRKFPGAAQRPGRKGDGYYIRVLPAPALA
jgi:hypothetical protein